MPNTPKNLYQYADKDDTYELLGQSTGAGTSQGHDVTVYRDIHTGRLFHRLPADFTDRMQHIGERLDLTPDTEDIEFLREALELLEYVTFHDGRYRQESSAKFQRPAQQLVTRLAERLGVKPYQSLKEE